MIKEFREFALRGNVIDMGVGIIIGAAFGKIVTSFVSDVLTPPQESVEIFRGVQRPSFHLFHRCGHLPAIEQPLETTEVLRRWLAVL